MNTVNLDTQYPSKTVNVLIIGGGAGGCGSALALADAGYQVVLIERNTELLSATSNATPCRLGLGFHYMDRATAFGYLEASINFVKKFPGYKLGEAKGLSENDPLRRGRYFITTDSLYPANEILDLFDDLRTKYEQLISEDPGNKVFGEPKDFFRILPPNEYENNVNMAKVELGIETAEHLLDWPAFKQYLINKISQHPNIKVLTQLEVIKLNQSTESAGLGYAVICRNTQNNEILELTSPYILNASWQNIEKINATAGFHNADDKRVNRLKVMIQVTLPEELKNQNSMFFCFGPHCSFSNRGDGTGFITYEPKTNIGQSTELNPPEMFERLAKQLATVDEQQKYSKEIIDGVAEYIPAMKAAEFKSIRFGIVKTKGEAVNIYAKESGHHKRSDSGVAERSLGLLENGCMKLLYLQKNSQLVKELFEKHLQADTTIQTIITDSYKNSINFFSTDKKPDININLIQRTFSDYCRRYGILCENKKASPHLQTAQISQTARFKLFLNEGIKRLKPPVELVKSGLLSDSTSLSKLVR